MAVSENVRRTFGQGGTDSWNVDFPVEKCILSVREIYDEEEEGICRTHQF